MARKPLIELCAPSRDTTFYNRRATFPLYYGTKTKELARKKKLRANRRKDQQVLSGLIKHYVKPEEPEVPPGEGKLKKQKLPPVVDNIPSEIIVASFSPSLLDSSPCDCACAAVQTTSAFPCRTPSAGQMSLSPPLPPPPIRGEEREEGGGGEEVSRLETLASRTLFFSSLACTTHFAPASFPLHGA